MSVKPFEQYLAEDFLAWALRKARPGFRFQFKSPDASNAVDLHRAFLAHATSSLAYDGTTLPIVRLESVNVLPVLHADNDDGFTENYISHLRDLIAGGDSPFDGTALLIIHNSRLDTIISSAENLSGQGNIWHPQSLADRLGALIQHSNGKFAALQCLLEDQREQVEADESTVFGFAAIYRSITGPAVDYPALQLFKDSMLDQMGGNKPQIRRRINENRALRERVGIIAEKYGDQADEILRDEFGEQFIREHFIDGHDWAEVPYDDYLSERKASSAQTVTFEKVLSTPEAIVHERARSASKSGQRDVSVILEVPEGESESPVELVFLGNDIKADQIKIVGEVAIGEDAVTINRIGGKRCRITFVVPFSGSPTYLTVRLRRQNSAENHQFRFLLVQKNMFYVVAFKSLFRVEPKQKFITLQMLENTLSLRSDKGETLILRDSEEYVDASAYAAVDFSKLTDSLEQIRFGVRNGKCGLLFNIEGAAADEAISVPLLFDKDRSEKLLTDVYFAEFNSRTNRLILDNRESAAVGVRLQLLTVESAMVSGADLSYGKRSLPVSTLAPNYPELSAAYAGWITYLDSRRTSPSLVSWGEDFCALTQTVLDEYERALSSIPLNSVLTDSQRALLSLGMATIDNTEYFTPFHPIVLSYHLQVATALREERKRGFDSLKIMPPVTRERLSAAGLIPYVYESDIAAAHVVAVKENSFWLQLVPQRDASYGFVRRLVMDKLNEFGEAYSRLIARGGRNTLVVNALNLGRAHELLLGILDYVRSRGAEACSIHVNFYDEELLFSDFDRFSENASVSDLKDWLRLDEDWRHDDVDLLVDLVRSRLTYSKFTTPKVGQSLKYAHLAFFRNNARVDVRTIDIESSLSGVLCNGLIAGEASEAMADSYFTAFGLRNAEFATFQTLRIARAVGGLLQPARQHNAQYSGRGIGVAASTEFKGLLTSSYDSALWTTIIDPKVTLDFFTSQRDVVLIHYSDQYTSSAGYDAITVTKQVDIFQRLLGSDALLSEFNAFNGEWLLKMLTANDKIRKERRGIIGAYKFVRAMLARSEISWVPLSVAEMVRVSGNVGLDMSSSDFARGLHAANKGAFSDDVLFVGFDGKKMHLLPIEVKTGAKPDFTKAVSQAKELRKFLEERILGPNSFASRLYRGLFVRQVLMQVEKYKLYGVLDEQGLRQLLPNREWWMRGDYSIGQLEGYPHGMVIAHLDSEACFDPSYELIDDVLRVELPISLLDSLINANDHLKLQAVATACHVPPAYLLQSQNPTSATSVELPLALVTKTPAPSQVGKNIEAVDQNAIVTRAKDLPLRILFGHQSLGDAPLYWEPTNTAKFMNTNSGIIGTMGTGKTQFTKSLITQLVWNQQFNVDRQPIGILIFDYKSDYVDAEFTKASGAKKYQLSKLPYNPLSLFGNMPMLPLHTAAGFAETMTRAYGLGKKQQLKLENLVIESYANVGILPEDSSTWSLPPPTIDDVWTLFLGQEKVEEDSLYAALSKLARFKIFESDKSKLQSLYELLDGVTVIELAGFSPDIQNLVVGLTLDLFHSQMQKQGKPRVSGDFRQITKMILVDEADNFMSQNFPALRKILKEGREYGVGLTLSTQDITHFRTTENDYAAYILTWVVHRVAQIRNVDIKIIFNKDDRSDQEQLMETVRKLDKHCSLYIDGEKRVHKMRDRAFWELLGEE